MSRDSSPTPNTAAAPHHNNSCCCVCDKQLAATLYRCRLCRLPYCNATCFKRHQEGCPGNVAEHDSQKQQQLTSSTDPATTYDDAVDRLESSPAITKRSREEDDHVDDLVVLRREHLSAIANNLSIRNALKSEELKKLVRIIDGSRSRLDALDAALHNIPEFREFCNEVIMTIYGTRSPRAS